MRLIDADALEEQIKNGHCNLCKVFDCEACGVNVALEYIEDALIIDAVPVVRCKDCKHFFAPCDSKHGSCDRTGVGCSTEEFCSDGERKDT